ncbi:MAG: type IX secretion system sortase PorU [Bacteroidetes bacterium]|nr:type IX secretion system sortase PorU [Bacteroidota bacterium]
MKPFVLIAILFILSHSIPAKSQSANFSVGSWYQVSVSEAGVYKIDGLTLKKWGVTLNALASNTIRLYGNGGAMLPESNSVERVVGLQENAIQVVDGGDGFFNENDFFLFYAPGPHRWSGKSVEQTLRHQKNLYANEAYYYLTIGGAGLRIGRREVTGLATETIDAFEDRYFYENDLVNLLKSGKQWLGEEFANLPGKKTSYEFTVPMPQLLSGESVFFRSNVAARSVGASSSFNATVNGISVLRQTIFPVSNDQYASAANLEESEVEFPLNQSSITVRYDFSPGSVGATGWLNWFEVMAKRKLDMSGLNQLHFYHSAASAGLPLVFSLKNAEKSLQVWEVTNPLRPVGLATVSEGNNILAKDFSGEGKTYIAFGVQGYLTVKGGRQISNQQLRTLRAIDYLIVSHPTLRAEGQRLAEWHRTNNNLNSAVVTTEEIYHEFSSGTPDPSAIRDYVRFLRDTAIAAGMLPPRYLLLLGDASYDYQDRIPDNTNLVPCFESFDSFNPLATYASDDFFGLLDEEEDVNLSKPSLLDIGIGRIPARNATEAKAVVDKIIRYHEPSSMGGWRNEITLVADDEDNNLHLEDAEYHAGLIQTMTDKIPNKIYLDAFRQQSGSGGSRYPEATIAVNNRILSGTLIWNYSGHGGFRRLAEEVILDNDMVNKWNNGDKLPLFVTATCDFAPYDNPSVNSLGESLLLRERIGAIALMTTTRVVFAFSNKIINHNFFKKALELDATGNYPTLGESIRQTKNLTYSTFGDIVNNRKFMLLGDPAMRIGLANLKVRTTLINGKSVGTDTLKALEKYEINGEIIDANDQRITDFNGNVYPVIYDKIQTLRTRGNDPSSQAVDFQVQNNVLFKGKTQVTNGRFTYSFIVPKDINYNFGNGLISYYAEDGKRAAAVNEKSIVVGGLSNAPVTDDQGPLIRAWMNDEKFVNGGLVNQTPQLLLKFFDSSGVNASGGGIGHDITATLDDDPQQFFVLNDFYVAESGSFQRGSLRFQLPSLSEGNHFLRIKAWDVLNNSSEATIDFRVAKDEELNISNVYNYPNPFTSSTTFMFEHNRPGDLLQASVNIYTISGMLVKNIRQAINSKGNRSFEINWDGTDHFGRKIGRGVYIYQLEITDSAGKKKSVRQKLVLL